MPPQQFTDFVLGGMDSRLSLFWRYVTWLSLTPAELAEIFAPPEGEEELAYFTEKKGKGGDLTEFRRAKKKPGPKPREAEEPKAATPKRGKKNP